MSKTFCPIPWVFLGTKTNGEYRVCCNANQSLDGGLYRRQDGLISRADSETLEEVRNSQLATEMRLKMLRGQWHSSCLRCEKEEESGLSSRRLIESDLWNSEIDFEKAQSLTDQYGKIDTKKVPLRHFDVRLGNHCNLRCRSCGPSESSQWLKEHQQVWGTQSLKVDSKWCDSSFFLEEFRSALPHLKNIYFAGGEPLLIQSHYQLLEECVLNGWSKNLTLEYNTNLTFLPAVVLKLWKNFKEIKIGVSLDGIGPVNDYIRHPSRWSQIEKNLDVLDNADAPIVAWLVPTIMIYNILHIPQLMSWKLNKNFKRINAGLENFIFQAHPLHRPHFLNIQSLPIQIKKDVQKILLQEKKIIHSNLDKKFKQDAAKLDQVQHQVDSIFHGYISFMFQQDLSNSHKKFLHYTHKLDELRHEKFSEAIPQIAEIIGWESHIQSEFLEAP